jgi:hypothetical protein
MSQKINGRDVVAIPFEYRAEFVRDPMDALIKYGALPQRGRSLWLTEPEKLRAVCVLPNMCGGIAAVRRFNNNGEEWMAAVAHPVDDSLLYAIDDESFNLRQDWRTHAWHVHVDPGLGRGRKGDASGLAVGRILDQVDIIYGDEARRVNRYIVPLVFQIIAPEYGEITLSSISKFILQLRGIRGINITSFSYDGFQSAGAIQELTQAGLVTAGVRMDELGRLYGFGKPFSVDRTVGPHQELKEAINEQRILLPDYLPLIHEMNRLQDIPGKAPDHPVGGSKDTADAVAGCVGYLAEIGHAVYVRPSEQIVSAFDLPGMRDDDFHHYDPYDPGGARLAIE